MYLSAEKKKMRELFINDAMEELIEIAERREQSLESIIDKYVQFDELYKKYNFHPIKTSFIH